MAERSSGWSQKWTERKGGFPVGMARRDFGKKFSEAYLVWVGGM